MSEQRWTIHVCEPCGELVTWCRCEWLPRRPEPPSCDVVVVPASVLDEARSRVRELEDALRRIRDHGETHDEPCWALHNGDCADTMQEIARAALASSSAPGYANHVGAPGVLGEGPHNSDATDTTCPACGGDGSARAPFDGYCPAAPYHGCVPTTSHDTERSDDE